MWPPCITAGRKVRAQEDSVMGNTHPSGLVSEEDYPDVHRKREVGIPTERK